MHRAKSKAINAARIAAMYEWVEIAKLTRKPITQSITINGPETFRVSVLRVLHELQTKVPDRYVEAITLMPTVEYRHDLRDYKNPNKRIIGRSDGYFGIDGSGDNSKQLNTYECFLYVFLHELGHNVAGKENNDWSEAAANSYAIMVLRELRLI